MGTVMGHVPPGVCPEGAPSAPSPGVDRKVDSVMGGTRAGGERRLDHRAMGGDAWAESIGGRGCTPGAAGEEGLRQESREEAEARAGGVLGGGSR